MKKFAVLFVIALSTCLAQAKVATFTGKSSWTKTSCVDFSELEQLGVERSAEKNGIETCQETGATDCVILGSNTGFCNCYRCDGEAVVRGTPAQ